MKKAATASATSRKSGVSGECSVARVRRLGWHVQFYTPGKVIRDLIPVLADIDGQSDEVVAAAGIVRIRDANRRRLQVAPAAVATLGLAGFERETGWIAEACRQARPRPGVERVRLPGEAALGRKREAEQSGASLYPGIMDSLAARGQSLGIAAPAPL